MEEGEKRNSTAEDTALLWRTTQGVLQQYRKTGTNPCLCPPSGTKLHGIEIVYSWHRAAGSHNTNGAVAATALCPSTRDTPSTLVSYFHSDSGFRTRPVHWCLCA
jgi:hypothetical protein